MKIVVVVITHPPSISSPPSPSSSPLCPRFVFNYLCHDEITIERASEKKVDRKVWYHFTIISHIHTHTHRQSVGFASTRQKNDNLKSIKIWSWREEKCEGKISWEKLFLLWHLRWHTKWKDFLFELSIERRWAAFTKHTTYNELHTPSAHTQLSESLSTFIYNPSSLSYSIICAFVSPPLSHSLAQSTTNSNSHFFSRRFRCLPSLSITLHHQCRI
jgi:hypothetical protein